MSGNTENKNTGPVPSPLPTYIYKIIPSAPPSPIPAEWPLSELDKKDGFIHFSTAKQVSHNISRLFAIPQSTAQPACAANLGLHIVGKIPITAGLFFKDTTKLWVFKLPFAPFADGIRWEVPGTDGCPHLYGRNFGVEDVLSAKGFVRAEGQSWEEGMDGDEWLEQ